MKEQKRTEDIFFAFTTREELSMLGCELAANIVLPDYIHIRYCSNWRHFRLG